MKRTTTAATTAATTATAIRNDLKLAFPGIKFSVRSETYSGGDSVNIEYNDGVNRARVEQLLAKYKMGSFNGMEDIYEIDNRRDDVPQVKYIFVRRQMSAETKIVVAAEIGITPATFSEYNNSVGEWNETLIYRHFVTLEFGQHANNSTPVEIAELKTIADAAETKFQQTKRVDDSEVAFYAFRKYRVAVLSTGITLAEFIADNPNKYNALSAGERWQMELNGTKPETDDTDDTDGDDDGGGVVLVTDGDDVDLVGLLFDQNAGHSNANEIPMENIDRTVAEKFFIENGFKPLSLN